MVKNIFIVLLFVSGMAWAMEHHGGALAQLTRLGVQDVTIEYEEEHVKAPFKALALFGSLKQLIGFMDEDDEAIAQKNGTVAIQWNYSHLNSASKYKVAAADIKQLVDIAQEDITDYKKLNDHTLCIMLSLAHAVGASPSHRKKGKRRDLVEEFLSEIRERLPKERNPTYQQFLWELLHHTSYGVQQKLSQGFKENLPVMRLPDICLSMLGKDRMVLGMGPESLHPCVMDREGKWVGEPITGRFKAMLGEDRIVVKNWRYGGRSFIRIVDQEGKWAGESIPGKLRANLGENRIVVARLEGGIEGWLSFTSIIDRDGKRIGGELPGYFKVKLGEDRIVIEEVRGGSCFTRIIDQDGKQVGEKLLGRFKRKLGEDRIVVEGVRDESRFTRIIDREGQQIGGELPGDFKEKLGEDRLVISGENEGKFFTRIMDRDGKQVGVEYLGLLRLKLGEDRVVIQESDNFFTRIVDRDGKPIGDMLPGWPEGKLWEDTIVTGVKHRSGKSFYIVDRDGKQIGEESPFWYVAKLGEDRIAVGLSRDWQPFIRIIDRKGNQVDGDVPGRRVKVLPNGLLSTDKFLHCPVPLEFSQHLLFANLFSVIEQKIEQEQVAAPRTLSTILSNVTFQDIFISMPDEVIRILHRVHGKALEQAAVGNMIERLKKLFTNPEQFAAHSKEIHRLMTLFKIDENSPLKKELKNLDEQMELTKLVTEPKKKFVIPQTEL